jgi:hypothetical protein
MFDNLRDFSDEPLYEDETNDPYKDSSNVGTSSSAPAPVSKSKKKKTKKFLGMTAPQRLILSVLLMVSVCMVGTLALLLLGKMSI